MGFSEKFPFQTPYGKRLDSLAPMLPLDGLTCCLPYVQKRFRVGGLENVIFSVHKRAGTSLVTPHAERDCFFNAKRQFSFLYGGRPPAHGFFFL